MHFRIKSSAMLQNQRMDVKEIIMVLKKIFRDGQTHLCLRCEISLNCSEDRCVYHVSFFQPEDPDVILLKKARQEKKVKRYLEDNFQNRQGRKFYYIH